MEEPEHRHDKKAIKEFAAFSVLAIALIGIPVVVFAASKSVNTDIKAAPLIQNDVNRDGKVSLDDVDQIRKVIEIGEYTNDADINHDNYVNEADVATFYKDL